MKHKTLVFASLTFLLIAGVVIWLIAASKKNAPLYGTFVYQNVDGSVATVTITEQNAHFENVDFTSAQINAALWLAVDEFKEAEKEAVLGDEELEQRQDEILSGMDFDAAFQGKTVAYTDTKFIEEYSQYYYYIINDETGPYGLNLCIDLNSKVLIIEDMRFTFQKDK